MKSRVTCACATACSTASRTFASEQWQRIVVDRGHPGQVHRRHFEACVFTYLASELRTGDIAVRGSQAFANWAEQLLPWSDCEELLDEFCAETGLPNTARAFTDQLRTRLANQAAAVDAKYPENAEHVHGGGPRHSWA